jgi:eukaryotic-like serine/threonine-protein kinase
MVGSRATAQHDNPDAMPDEPIAGRYRLIEPLGRGAMSAVWLAHDDELGRDVAVKTLAPSADRERFEREARAAAALSHPNICAVYDYGRTDERRYLVLEYLPNGSLEDLLRRSAPLRDDEVRRIAYDIASGLEHAHERGLVHRDLKPANILFDAERRAKIADFGIARLGDARTLTETGTVLGTASYISPEQASGEPAGPESDVYSFGVILYRMLTGALPFTAGNAMEVVRLHRDEPPPDVRLRRPDAPPDLAAVTMAALAKDPRARPHDGHALRGLLGAGDTQATLPLPVLPALAGAATEVSRVHPPERRSRRLPVVLGAVVAAGLLLGGVVLAVILTNGGGTPAPTHAPIVPATTTTAPTATETPTAPTTTAPTTSTAPTTTAAQTTAPTTTAELTTTAETTTAPETIATAPTTTAATTTAQTTTAPETTTTAPTTTAATTTTGTTTTTAP